MRGLGYPVLIACALAVSVGGAGVAAADGTKRLAAFRADDAEAVALGGPGWCGPRVRLRLTAPGKAALQGPALARTMRAVGSALAAECPAARRADLEFFVRGGQQPWQAGTADGARGWSFVPNAIPQMVLARDEIRPIEDFAERLRGRTIFLGENRVGGRPVPWYFRADGALFHYAFKGDPWAAHGSTVCIEAKARFCWTAVRHVNGRSYIIDTNTGRHREIAAWAPGDVARMQERARNKTGAPDGETIATILLGAMAAGLGAGGGGGSRYETYPDYDGGGRSSPSGGGSSAPPVSSFYGGCHGGSFYGC